MKTATAIDFDGLFFLDELERVFKLQGLDGVIPLVENSVPVGRHIKMKHDIKNIPEPVYKIERVSIININSQQVVWTNGDRNSVSIIRSINLPYVNAPFQIDIYGSSVS